MVVTGEGLVSQCQRGESRNGCQRSVEVDLVLPGGEAGQSQGSGIQDCAFWNLLWLRGQTCAGVWQCTVHCRLVSVHCHVCSDGARDEEPRAHPRSSVGDGRVRCWVIPEWPRVVPAVTGKSAVLCA